MAKAWKSGAALMAAVLALGRCQSPPRVDVEQQWADTMSNLNMFGFFPQTEDVQVGGPAPNSTGHLVDLPLSNRTLGLVG